MRRLANSPRQGRPVTIEVDGEPVNAIEGEPAACALLAAGERVFARSVKYHRPRGPTCFAAACSNCLMRVDGVPNQYTCKIPVHPGMRLERQNAFPSAKLDVFASIDWMFPKGLDHHEMFAGVPVADKVMAKVARHLAGLGWLPKTVPPDFQPGEIVRTPVCIVGAGAAGLAASRSLAQSGVEHVLLEQEDFTGGWRALSETASVSELPHAWTSAAALAFYSDEGGKFLLVLANRPEARLVKIYAQQYLLTVGGQGALLPFDNNDLPGVMTGRAGALLLHREGLMPGEEIAVVGESAYVAELTRWIRAAGGNVCAELITEGKDASAKILKAHGPKYVRALSYEDTGGRKHKVRCDCVLLALPSNPSFELARQAGAQSVFSDAHQTFVVRADDDGRTAATDIWVAGDARGALGSFESAHEQGIRAAQSICKHREAAS